MKYLRKFNENSHDWASNAMPGASDEEIIKARFGDEDPHKPEDSEAECEPCGDKEESIETREEVEARYQQDWDSWLNRSRVEVVPEPRLSDYLKQAGLEPEDKPSENPFVSKEDFDKDEQKKPNVGSRIKSFLGFGKK